MAVDSWTGARETRNNSHLAGLGCSCDWGGVVGRHVGTRSKEGFEDCGISAIDDSVIGSDCIVISVAGVLVGSWSGCGIVAVDSHGLELGVVVADAVDVRIVLGPIDLTTSPVNGPLSVTCEPTRPDGNLNTRWSLRV